MKLPEVIERTAIAKLGREVHDGEKKTWAVIRVRSHGHPRLSGSLFCNRGNSKHRAGPASMTSFKLVAVSRATNKYAMKNSVSSGLLTTIKTGSLPSGYDLSFAQSHLGGNTNFGTTEIFFRLPFSVFIVIPTFSTTGVFTLIISKVGKSFVTAVG